MLGQWIGESHLTEWPTIGLVIFFAAFVAVTIKALLFTRASDAARAAAMPLDDGSAGDAERGAGHGTR